MNGRKTMSLDNPKVQNRVQLRSFRGGRTSLILGSTLVVTAVAGVSFSLLGSGGGARYWVARLDLPAGAVLSEDLVELRNANLEQSAKVYLPADAALNGMVLTVPVSAGALLPTASVAEAQSGDAIDGLVSVVLQPTSALSSRLRSGSVVDIWSSAKEINGRYGLPTKLVEAAQVFRISKETAAFKDVAPQVELRVAKLSLPGLLAATADEATITLVARDDIGQQ